LPTLFFARLSVPALFKSTFFPGDFYFQQDSGREKNQCLLPKLFFLEICFRKNIKIFEAKKNFAKQNN